MKLLIYGSRGWIGKQFLEILYSQGIPYHIGAARVDDTDKLDEELKRISPTNVISRSKETWLREDRLERLGRISTSLKSSLTPSSIFI